MKMLLFDKLKKIIQLDEIVLRNIFLALAISSLIVMVWASRTSAISGDEHKYIAQAEKVYNYFASGGEDKSAIKKVGIDPQHYNSQSFDVIVYTLDKWLNIKDTFRFRHQMNAITGWLMIFFAALIAIDLGGFRLGILTLLLLLASPRIIGHSFNNHRDIPLALSFVFTIYFLIQLIKQYPKIPIKYGMLITIGVASAFSLRLAGGVLLIAFVNFFVVANYFIQNSFKGLFKKEIFKAFLSLSVATLVFAVAGYFLGILIWPFGLENPIKNSIEVFKASSDLQVYLQQLFEGKNIRSDAIPWYYTLKFMLLTTPVIILVGFAISLILVLLKKQRTVNYLYFIVLITGVAPLIYTSLFTKSDYGGWRHFLFVYPFIVIIAACGILGLIRLSGNKVYRLLIISTTSIIILIPATFILKYHPYQYVYFNELQGGVKNAYKYYETDYSCNGLLGGSNWIIKNVLPNLAENEVVKISTNYTPAANEYFNDYSEKIDLQYTRYYEKSKKDWDYAVYYCAYITAYQLQNNLWPPKGTIYTEEVAGFPIGAVVKRISHEDYEGFEALKKRRIPEAKEHFRKFLALYPENEEVLEGYSRAFLMERNLDSTVYYADLSLKYNPRQMGALLLKASALNSKKAYNEALMAANEMENIKSDFPEGLFQKGFALKNLNQPNEALKAFQQAIAAKKDYSQAYLQMGEILSNYKNYPKAINLYDQLLKTNPNDLYAKAYKAKSLQLSGDNIQAENIINALPAANQNNVEVVKVKCRIALAKNDLATAANFINMARFITNDADLFALRAKFVLAQNNRQQAEAFLKKAAELDPVNREVQELMKQVQAAGSQQIAQQKNNTTTQTQEQQSIMFQKPKPKKNSPIAFPKR